MVRKYEYSVSENGRVGSINLDRMILLYLNNSQNIMSDEEFPEKEYVPLNVLYLEVLKFCKKPETIVDAIWNMYDLQNTEMWNHLVTFDDMKIITVSELQSEMDAVLQKKENFNFARVKITLAGQAYLNYILPHFEYYASRSALGHGYSLYGLSPDELCDIHKIEKTIKSEKKEVSECCKRLYLFFGEIFDKIDEFKGKNFLETQFASVKASKTKKTISRMYHCEKIIYSNIGYLDSFRFFIFYMFDEVMRNGGFETDVNITDYMHRINLINKGIKKNLPEELFDINNEKIILKQKNEVQIAELHKNNGDIVRCTVPLDAILRMIKVCYNKSLVDAIIDLMRMFGFYNGSQCAKYSNGTNNIHEAFDACISCCIIPSQYEDFKTHITYEVGEKIIAEGKKKERRERQEKRRQKNSERKESYTVKVNTLNSKDIIETKGTCFHMNEGTTKRPVN